MQWLRGFFYVAQTGSVSAAARKMNRNQPTVSQQIKNLEHELGGELFDRSKGRMELSPQGMFLLDKTITIFDVIKEIQDGFTAAKQDLSGQITVATTHAVILYFLPGYVVSFRKQHPNVQFQLVGGGLDMILQMVESSQADFGLASLRKIPSGLDYQTLFKTGMKLISPPGNPFHLDNPPTMKQIAAAPFIAFPSTSTITQFLVDVFRKRKMSLNVIQVLNNFEMVKKYVQLGLGIAILDEYAIAPEDKNLLILDLGEDFPPRDYGLILRNRKYLPPQADAFIKSLKNLSKSTKPH